MVVPTIPLLLVWSSSVVSSETLNVSDAATSMLLMLLLLLTRCFFVGLSLGVNGGFLLREKMVENLKT